MDFLTITRDTTVKYGLANAELRKAGSKIPTNDVWIAAHVKEHGAQLWTRDRHFRHIAALSLHEW